MPRQHDTVQLVNNLEGVIGRVLGRVGTLRIRPQEDLAAAADRLLAMPAARRRLWVGHSRADHCPQLAHHLLERAWAARWGDPAHALHILDAADDLLAHVDGVPSGVRADLRGRTVALRANARRLGGDLAGAARLFDCAEDDLLRGSGDVLLWSELLRLRASLAADHRRWSHAQDLLRPAHRLAVAAGEPATAVRILIKSGLYYSYAGDDRRALRTLLRAVHDIDAIEHPEDLLHAVHSLAAALDSAGRPGYALDLLERSGRIAAGVSRGVMVHRVHWLEARIRHQLGQHTRAAVLLQRLTRSYSDAGRPFEAGLCHLEAALAQASIHRWGQARHHAHQALHTLQALDIPRDATAALLLLRQALQRQALDLTLLRQTITRLDPTPRPRA